MIEFGLVFGSILAVPFVFLTVFLVEFYARDEQVARHRAMLAGFFSPLFIALVGLIGTLLRSLPFEASAADVFLGLMRPLVIVTFVINAAFSLFYLFLRTDLFGE